MPRPDHLQGSHVGEMCECGGSKYRYSWLCRSCRTQANRLKINPRFAPSEVPDAVETAYAAGFYEDFMSAIELHLSPRRVDQLNEARARLEAFRG